LREDVKEFPEITIVGISKNSEVLDEYRGLFSVEMKPFGKRAFDIYTKEVKAI
jgi:hypothetical protein